MLYQLSHSGSDSATLRFGIRQSVKTFMTFRTPPHPVTNLRTNSLFRRAFGDAFPSNLDVAYSLCERGGVGEGCQLVHFGSGTGSVSYLLASRTGCSVAGVDSSAQLVELAKSERQNTDVEFQHSPLTQVPYPDGWGTHLLTESILTRTPTLPPMFDEIRRLLSSDGKLLNSEIVVADGRSLPPEVARFTDLMMGEDCLRTIDGWRQVIEANGFDVLECREEPRVMRRNGEKLRRALMVVNMLRRTGRFSLAEFGLGAFENDFDETAMAGLKAMADGTLSYASFISEVSMLTLV